LQTRERKLFNSSPATSLLCIDTVELTLAERGLIAQPLDLLLLSVPQGFIGSPLSLAST
jgi:hypothetical protein